MKKNDVFEIEITDITNDGDGVGKKDGFVWFVKDSIPGDLIEASVMKLKKNYGYARLVRVIRPSADRVEAACKKARACGGCTLQSMNYAAQLRYKRNKVKNNLVRIGGFDEALIEQLIDDTIGMKQPWRYRNKAIIPVGRDKNGELTAGFYAAHSHNIIECKDCLLQPEEFAGIVESMLEDFDVEDFTHILLRKGFKTGQIMGCLVENHDNNAVLSGKITHVYGDEIIEDYIGNLKFIISPRSFFQVNPIQVERLYSTALDFAELTGNEIVWDLYCGIGTISLSLALKAKKVYGVEIVPDAIRDAKKNAEINGINNVEFFVGKAEEVTLRDDFERPDVVVVDPPRKGCDGICLETMLCMAPDRIVYVSCDSATLARDIKILCDGGYRLEKIQPVDMFPQTTHVETVCLLVLRNPVTHVNIDVNV